MKYLTILAILFTVGCSSAPTQPEEAEFEVRCENVYRTITAENTLLLLTECRKVDLKKEREERRGRMAERMMNRRP